MDSDKTFFAGIDSCLQLSYVVVTLRAR